MDAGTAVHDCWYSDVRLMDGLVPDVYCLELIMKFFLLLLMFYCIDLKTGIWQGCIIILLFYLFFSLDFLNVTFQNRKRHLQSTFCSWFSAGRLSCTGSCTGSLPCNTVTSSLACQFALVPRVSLWNVETWQLDSHASQRPPVQMMHKPESEVFYWSPVKYKKHTKKFESKEDLEITPASADRDREESKMVHFSVTSCSDLNIYYKFSLGECLQFITALLVLEDDKNELT